MEGDAPSGVLKHPGVLFQSTPSAWRETRRDSPVRQAPGISIHSLRMEGDTPYSRTVRRPPHFNPLPPHGGRLAAYLYMDKENRISIHSLRMEGDRCCQQRFFRTTYFNPLPPHGGRRTAARTKNERRHFNPLPPHGGRRETVVPPFPSTKFQSTPSAWRETAIVNRPVLVSRDFNPLPPHGGRQQCCHAGIV